jgi:hypothetical protein
MDEVDGEAWRPVSMRWSDIPFHPNRRTLRQFGLIGAAVFAGLGLWRLAVSGVSVVFIMFALFASAFALLAMLRPHWLRPIYVGWMVVAFPIGWLVSQLILALMYYGVITPIGLLFRLAGRDALSLRRSGTTESYWKEKPAVTDARRYFQQF